jgi:hypothetical protein
MHTYEFLHTHKHTSYKFCSCGEHWIVQLGCLMLNVSCKKYISTPFSQTHSVSNKLTCLVHVVYTCVYVCTCVLVCTNQRKGLTLVSEKSQHRTKMTPERWQDNSHPGPVQEKQECGPRCHHEKDPVFCCSGNLHSFGEATVFHNI